MSDTLPAQPGAPLCETIVTDESGYPTVASVNAAVENGQLREASARAIGCLGECSMCLATVHVDTHLPFVPPQDCLSVPVSVPAAV